MKGILTNDNGDLHIAGGKMQIGECSQDIAERVLRAYPGEFKESPEIGLYALEQLNGKPDPFWSGKARKQLAEAGLSVKSIEIKNDEVNLILE